MKLKYEAKIDTTGPTPLLSFGMNILFGGTNLVDAGSLTVGDGIGVNKVGMLVGRENSEVRISCLCCLVGVDVTMAPDQ